MLKWTHVALSCLGILLSNSTLATQIFAIDSIQSYVEAYAPKWTAYMYTPYFVAGPGSSPPPSTLEWQLDWVVKRYQLSGDFAGAVDASPWTVNWAHLNLNATHLLSNVPSYVQAVTLPSQITFSLTDGSVAQIDPCRFNDPYNLPTLFGVGTCFNGGATPTLTGMFDGQSLALTGTSGLLDTLNVIAPLTAGTIETIANPGSPPLLDPSLYPTHWLRYQVVASTVPEPATLLLILVGSMLLMVISGIRPARQVKKPQATEDRAMQQMSIAELEYANQ